MKFNEFGLSDYILKGLEDQGFDTPTEIQTLAFPLIQSGKDVIGLSHTGSGKTYAFGIPALECIDNELTTVQVLIVCPTRELVAQEVDALRKLTNFTEGIKIVPVFGGSNMDRQITAIKKNARMVIGTPGRLMDHLRRKTLKLGDLKMIVLDEADEMLNMGFKEDIETILESVPSVRQTIMFSATMPPEIMKLTKDYMSEPVLIRSKLQESPQTFIKQYYVRSGKEQKLSALCSIYDRLKPTISIVFCNTKKMTEQLAEAMSAKGLAATCLHGDMRQRDRKIVMDDFKKKGAGILVATDVAARGIDVKNVDLVVNYDLPNNDDYYIHRIGRTGRAGKEGTAYTIINTQQQLIDLKKLAIRDGNKIEEYIDLGAVAQKVENHSEKETRNSQPHKKFGDVKKFDNTNKKFGDRNNKFSDRNNKFGNRDKNSDRKKDNFQTEQSSRQERKPYFKKAEEKGNEYFKKDNAKENKDFKKDNTQENRNFRKDDLKSNSDFKKKNFSEKPFEKRKEFDQSEKKPFKKKEFGNNFKTKNVDDKRKKSL